MSSQQHGPLQERIEQAISIQQKTSRRLGQILVERPMSPTEQLILDLLTTIRTAGIDPGVFVREPQPIEIFADRLQDTLAAVLRFNDPKGIYSHCFCEISP